MLKYCQGCRKRLYTIEHFFSGVKEYQGMLSNINSSLKKVFPPKNYVQYHKH